MTCKVELWMATWMVLLRPSAIRMKRNGESESPYQMPLEGLNVEVGVPLRRMEKNEEEMGEYIHWIQVGWKPKAFKIPLMYCQLILSNAFDIFNFISIPGV